MPTNHVKQFLESLTRRNIILDILGSKIRCHVPPGEKLSSIEKQILRQKKQDIISELAKKKPDGDIESISKVTPLQEGMIFHSIHEPESDQYNVIVKWKYQGNFQPQKLRLAWQSLIDHHSVFRTKFIWEGVDYPVQAVCKHAPITWRELDWSHLSEQQQIRELAEFIEQEKAAGIDLQKPCSMRLALIKLRSDAYEFVWIYHHILLDGWSLPIVFQELVQTYESLVQNQAINLVKAPAYSCYLDWVSKQSKPMAMKFWSSLLNGFDTCTPIPWAKQSLSSHKHIQNLAHTNLKFSENETKQLIDFAKNEQITINAMLQFSWALLLAKLASKSEALHGMVVSGRPADLENVDNMVGLFINTIPLRINIDYKDTAITHLKSLHKIIQESNDYSFINLTELKKLTSISSNEPFFYSLLVFENYPIPNDIDLSNSGELKVCDFSCIEKTNYPMTIIIQNRSNLNITFSYDGDCFSEESVANLSDLFKRLIMWIVHNGSRPLKDLNLLSDNDRAVILEELNQTTRMIDKNQSIVQRFESQVKTQPNKIAVRDKHTVLTYGELNQQANRLARRLRKNYLAINNSGITATTLIGIYLSRGIDMIIATLAVLKAGGAYLPIDVENPPVKTKEILQDSNCKLVICNELIDNNLVKVSSFLDLCAISKHLQLEDKNNLAIASQASDLAYVMYTSGSSGKPKGVCIPQSAILNLVIEPNFFDFEPTTCVGQLANHVFDAATFEIWGPLLNGASLTIVAYEDILDPQLFAEALANGRVNTIFLTTALFQRFCEQIPDVLNSMWTIFFGGESPNCPIIHKFLKAKSETLRLVHVYGPTECTTFSHFCEINAKHLESTILPIGKPLSNKTQYVLDNYLNPVPFEVDGELYIGGEGLAIGYLNQPELTRKKFIPNPFLHQEAGLAEELRKRIYKTGDLVKLQKDGSLVFIRRLDTQVKLRGHRIELGDIENTIRGHENIKEAVLMLSDRGIQKHLICFYQPKNFSQDLKDDLKDYARTRLASYMIPGEWIMVPEFALNSNGKIDRASLPFSQLDESAILSSGVRPSTPKEEILAVLWKNILNLSEIDIHSNFFELGGDSIMIIQLISRAREAGLIFTSKDVFANPTVDKLAGQARWKEAKDLAEDTTEDEEYKLSPIQTWFFELGQEHVNHFNQSSLFKISSWVDLEALNQALNLVTNHHDTFRLRFKKNKNVWTQHYSKESGNLLMPSQKIEILASSNEQFLKAIEPHCNQAHQTLNITLGPLAKRIIFDGHPDGHPRLFITVHHLIIDGVSWRILVEDVHTVYNQIVNGETPKLQYKSSLYGNWIKQLTTFANNINNNSEWDYWLDICSNSPLPPIPMNSTCPTGSDFRNISIDLDSTTTRKLLKEVPNAYHTQINDILLAALSRALYESWHIVDALLLLEGHGREESVVDLDISRTIGWFTTIFPLRLQCDTKDLANHIIQIKETLRALPSKGAGYSALKYLSKDARTKALALNNCWLSFNYLGQLDVKTSKDSIFSSSGILQSVGESSDPSSKAPCVISINAFICSEKLCVSIDFSAKHVSADLANNLGQAFSNSLKELVDHCCALSEARLTPSDFPLADVQQDVLATIDTRNTQDIYALTPLQQGMLIHSLIDDSDTYHTQMVCVFDNLDPSSFKSAWEHIVEKFDIFRTKFVLQDFSDPIQIVCKKGVLDWFEDLSSFINTDADSDAVQGHINNQRLMSFNLSTGNTMRLSLLRLSGSRHLLCWTHHHILIDGWSLSVVVKELLNAYRKLALKEKICCSPESSFKDYIAWLKQQDDAEALVFWRTHLNGFEEPNLIHPKLTSLNVHKSISKLNEYDIELDEKLSTQLASIAREQRITPNVIFQLAWAKLVMIYSSSQSATFGVTVSGRPGELRNVENAVGLFINTVPLHIKSCPQKSIISHLKCLQDTMREINQFSFLSLINIQSAINVPSNSTLFYSLLVYENYPVEAFKKVEGNDLGVSLISSSEKTNYPLTIIIIPGSKFKIRIAYDASTFDRLAIKALTANFQVLLKEVATNPSLPLDNIPLNPL